MKKNKLQWYDDLTLEYFYKSISNYQEHIRLPHHDVVYVRAAIAGATGKTFPYEIKDYDPDYNGDKITVSSILQLMVVDGITYLKDMCDGDYANAPWDKINPDLFPILQESKDE